MNWRLPAVATSVQGESLFGRPVRGLPAASRNVAVGRALGRVLAHRSVTGCSAAPTRRTASCAPLSSLAISSMRSRRRFPPRGRPRPAIGSRHDDARARRRAPSVNPSPAKEPTHVSELVRPLAAPPPRHQPRPPPTGRGPRPRRRRAGVDLRSAGVRRLRQDAVDDRVHDRRGRGLLAVRYRPRSSPRTRSRSAAPSSSPKAGSSRPARSPRAARRRRRTTSIPMAPARSARGSAAGRTSSRVRCSR